MQRSLRLAIPELGTEDYEFVSISVDIVAQPEEIEVYSIQYEFDWIFTVASEEFLRNFIDQYGRAVITTPNMVHFVIQPDGTITQMYQGSPSPDQLIDEIRGATVG